MAAHRRRRKKLVFGEGAALAVRAFLIAIDWWTNGHGPR